MMCLVAGGLEPHVAEHIGPLDYTVLGVGISFWLCAQTLVIWHTLCVPSLTCMDAYVRIYTCIDIHAFCHGRV